jgi:hypothetical protein
MEEKRFQGLSTVSVPFKASGVALNISRILTHDFLPVPFGLMLIWQDYRFPSTHGNG